MDPLTTAETTLASEDFRTWQHPDETQRVYFEDLSLFGMVTTYPSLPDLLKQWQDRQDRFLEEHADALRAEENKEKVWNAYTVHLAVGDFADGGEERVNQEDELFRIEENFRGTRKIARASVTDESDVTEALLPLISFRQRPELAAEDYRERLRNELSKEFDKPFLRVLEDESLVDEIVNELLSEQ